MYWTYYQTIGHRPVTRRKEGRNPLQTFSPPLEKSVGHSWKLLDIVWMGPFQKTLHHTWCSKLVTGLGKTVWWIGFLTNNHDVTLILRWLSMSWDEFTKQRRLTFIYWLCKNHASCLLWVRQGGILSPYLFAVYLDELSIQLGSARVGCTVRNMVVNHLMFADDICAFTPRISGLQCLLNICGDYAAEHEITFNWNKTIGVLFCPKKYKQPAPSNVFLNGARVEFFDQVKYLGV